MVVNRATRLAQYFRRNDKKYDAILRFGVETDTYDRDGEIVSTSSDFSLTRGELEDALRPFQGTFLQTPPPVSAKKVQGVPAYKLARRNAAVDLPPVEVTVESIELLEFTGATARIVVHCTAGTYVRSIAHELGRRLGCGAILDQLRRLASGDFTVEQARTLDDLQSLAGEGRLEEALIPAGRLLPDMPAEIVDRLTAGQIRQGRDFRVSPFRSRAAQRYVKAVTHEGELVAIGEAKLPNVYHPVLVL